MDDNTAKLLGISSPSVPAPPNKPVKRLDLSACLRDRYHHRMTYQAIGDKYGTSKVAVYQLLAKFEEQLGDPVELQGFVDIEDRIQAAIKRRYSSHLINVDLTKVSPRDAAIVYGTIYDKNRLQTGQSTSNQSVFFQVVGESSGSDVPQDVVVDVEFEDITE